jgi:HSP20 family molecular chaperone IbpA
VSLLVTSEGVFLEGAGPAQGWSVRPRETGPEKVRVEFLLDGEVKAKLTAAFEHGTLEVEMEPSSG